MSEDAVPLTEQAQEPDESKRFDAMEHILSAISAKLPENPTAEDLEQAISEVEAEQKARHARELAAMEQAHQVRMRRIKRRTMLFNAALLACGLALGTLVFIAVQAVTR